MYEFDNFLYPPRVDTFLPAFALSKPINNGEDGFNNDSNNMDNTIKYEKIPFVYIPISLSKFNSISQIGLFDVDDNGNRKRIGADIEIIIKSVDNINILNTKIININSETIITKLYFDTDTGSYYIRLPIYIFSFEFNYYYQLQARFISSEINNIPSEKEKILPITISLDNKSETIYINNNIDSQYLSEWSSVLLLKPIKEPYVLFDTTNFDIDMTSATSLISQLEELNLIGSVIWDKENMELGEAETLREVQLQLMDINKNVLYETSISSFTKNSLQGSLSEHSGLSKFECTIKYFLENKTKYFLKLNFITSNLYTFERTFSLQTEFNYNTAYWQNWRDFLEVETPFKVGLNEKGEINILIKWNSYSDYEDEDINLTIYRSDLNSHFLLWDKIAIVKIKKGTYGENSYSYNDITAQYGMWYKYAIKIGNNKKVSWEEGYDSYTGIFQSPIYYSENITPGFENKDIITPNFEDLYLIDKENYLTIKLNPTISSFKITNSDSSIETIGSKFPFVRRNSNISYRQMQIGGLISRHMDDNLQFASGHTLFGYYEHLYYLYNSVYKINDYNDVIYERLFREKVLEFLTNGKPKLLKSPTEGNIVVKLTNVTLTPNQQLGRMLYSFTATAIEITENNIDNLINLDIVNINKDFNVTYTPSLSNENAEYAASFITDTYILENTIFLPDVFYDKGAKIDIITESDDSNILTTFNSPLPI